MTPDEIKRLRSLAEASDEIWFEKVKFEHGEPYSDHVGSVPSSVILELLALADCENQKGESK